MFDIQKEQYAREMAHQFSRYLSPSHSTMLYKFYNIGTHLTLREVVLLRSEIDRIKERIQLDVIENRKTHLTATSEDGMLHVISSFIDEYYNPLFEAERQRKERIQALQKAYRRRQTIKRFMIGFGLFVALVLIFIMLYFAVRG